MTAKWGICAFLVLGLAFFAGCKSSQPNLKPDKAPERLVDPPHGRYGTPTYPSEAFERPEDPAKKALEARNGPGGIPTRGGMMPTGGSR